MTYFWAAYWMAVGAFTVKVTADAPAAFEAIGLPGRLAIVMMFVHTFVLVPLAIMWMGRRP